MPRLRHIDDTGTARFATVSCFQRRQLLTDEERIGILLEEIDSARQKHNLLIHGFVIMPNHIHLVLHSPDGVKLGAVIGEIKSRSARRIFQNMRESGELISQSLMIRRNGVDRPAFWHVRGFDHNCRTPEAVIEKINYCHNNPVKKGLVSTPEEWLWSSAGWYVGRRDGPIEIDTVELDLGLVI